MNTDILGIHHVTAIAGDPQRNIDFYTGVLGLRLVKLTVNFDDPGSYHLYYGDEQGHPGTLLTFFAWPRYYHWYFNQTMRYGIGDVTHSSGTHDHFNQWMWQRLLWSPQRTVEDLVAEYARTWFGPEAASLMAEAIFQLEDNLAEKPGVPITKKDGIDRYYRLVR